LYLSDSFYVKDAEFHIEKAIEALTLGSQDPELWMEEQLEIARVFQRLIPFAVRRTTQNLQEDHDQCPSVLDRLESGFGSDPSDYGYSSIRQSFEDRE
jgi:hypothetical protein